jgi:uncharacterized protein
VTLDQALGVIREHHSDIAAFGVSSLALFGSVARGEARADSDVDILVEFASGEVVGFFRFLRLKRYLEGILGREVDLVTRAALKPQLRERILKEAVDAAA